MKPSSVSRGWVLALCVSCGGGAAQPAPVEDAGADVVTMDTAPADVESLEPRADIPPPLSGDGEPCEEDADCSTGLVCNGHAWSYVCRAPGDIGGRCLEDGDCEGGLFCNFVTRRCQTPWTAEAPREDGSETKLAMPYAEECSASESNPAQCGRVWTCADAFRSGAKREKC